MKIKKILNNNTVIAIHESGEEVIVMESGLGFRRKKGDSISRNFMWIAMTWETAHWKEPKKNHSIGIKM